METKKCSKCGVEKALCEFGNRKDTKSGKRADCKVCNHAQKDKNRRANIERERERRRKWDRANKDKKKAYYEANKEKILKRHKRWCEENKEHLQAYYRDYDLNRRQDKAIYNKIYREQNAEAIRESKNSYARKRRNNDPAYRLRGLVSNAVWAALKNQGTTKGGSTFSALPYTPSDLAEHLEKQFDETMTWENYGDYWEVDHIYPQSLLPYDSLDHPNFQKCWALDNLQPLEKSENRAKSNKVLDA